MAHRHWLAIQRHPACAKRKRRGCDRAFFKPWACWVSSACHRRLGGAAEEPCQQQNASETNHCLGGYAPAGFLNAIVHFCPVPLIYPVYAALERRDGPTRLARSLAGHNCFRNAQNVQRKARGCSKSRQAERNFHEINTLIFRTLFINFQHSRQISGIYRLRMRGRFRAILGL